MNEYRITKYDPEYRVNGVYERCEWTSVSDVGGIFADGILTADECNSVISNYVNCVLEILEKSNVHHLTIADLEINDPVSWINGQMIMLNEVALLVQDCLKEKCWGRLSGDGVFVHFGYDLYMYVGCNLPRDAVCEIGEKYALFAEEFLSPHHPEDIASQEHSASEF